MTTTTKANRLRELRERGVRLSQEQMGVLLGHELGLPPFDLTTISKQETGSRSLSREQVEAYARIFRVSSYEIFVDPVTLPPTTITDDDGAD